MHYSIIVVSIVLLFVLPVQVRAFGPKSYHILSVFHEKLFVVIRVNERVEVSLVFGVITASGDGL